MGYVLTKEDPGGRIYALITPTHLIDYTLNIDTASVFQGELPRTIWQAKTHRGFLGLERRVTL